MVSLWFIVSGTADGKGKMPLISLLRRKKNVQIILDIPRREKGPIWYISGTRTVLPPFADLLRSVLLWTKLTEAPVETPFCLLATGQAAGVLSWAWDPSKRRAKFPRLS